MLQFLGASSDEADDLHAVALSQGTLLEVWSLQDLEIQLDHDAIRADFQLAQQLGDRRSEMCAPRLTVDLNLKELIHCVILSLIRWKQDLALPLIVNDTIVNGLLAQLS